MDRYTFYLLEFLEDIHPASKTNIKDLVRMCLHWHAFYLKSESASLEEQLMLVWIYKRNIYINFAVPIISEMTSNCVLKY